jgi:hypothetical protein
VVIGVFVGLSLLVAHGLQLERPYWVPVSCLAILQGASLRAAWTRQLHRIVGTALGLLVFLGIAQVPLGPWGVAAVLTALTLVIETLVVRHYGLVVVFITPLTILLAEAGQGSAMAPQRLRARRRGRARPGGRGLPAQPALARRARRRLAAAVAGRHSRGNTVSTRVMNACSSLR